MQNFLTNMCLTFLVLAIGGVAYALYGIYQVGSVDDYLEQGVYTFYPHDIKSKIEQIKRKRGGKMVTDSQTVYYLKYLPHERNGYYINRKFYRVKDARDTLKADIPVTRKILNIKDTKEFVDTDPAYSSADYVWEQRMHDVYIGLPCAVLVAILGFLFLYPKISAASGAVTRRQDFIKKTSARLV